MSATVRSSRLSITNPTCRKVTPDCPLAARSFVRVGTTSYSIHLAHLFPRAADGFVHLDRTPALENGGRQPKHSRCSRAMGSRCWRW
jgi:hypothetical protein